MNVPYTIMGSVGEGNEIQTPYTSSILASTPVQLVQAAPFSSFASITATLVVASAASIGTNMLAVKNGELTLPLAVVNGIAKGAAASYILSKTTRSTAGEIVVAASLLAGAAYFIDAKMKKNVLPDEIAEEGKC